MTLGKKKNKTFSSEEETLVLEAIRIKEYSNQPWPFTDLEGEDSIRRSRKKTADEPLIGFHERRNAYSVFRSNIFDTESVYQLGYLTCFN